MSNKSNPLTTPMNGKFNNLDFNQFQQILNELSEKESQLQHYQQLIKQANNEFYKSNNIRFNSSFVSKLEIIEEKLMAEITELKIDAHFYNRLYLSNQSLH